jgi:hypothetical protein
MMASEENGLEQRQLQNEAEIPNFSLSQVGVHDFQQKQFKHFLQKDSLKNALGAIWEDSQLPL